MRQAYSDFQFAAELAVHHVWRHVLVVIVQAKFHQERFRTYPHVDSPAKLIQELLKPGGTVTDVRK